MFFDNWHSEYEKYWNKILVMKVFYGNDSQEMSATKKSRTLPSNSSEASRAIRKAFPPTDPMSAFGVVVDRGGVSTRQLSIYRAVLRTVWLLVSYLRRVEDTGPQPSNALSLRIQGMGQALRNASGAPAVATSPITPARRPPLGGSVHHNTKTLRERSSHGWHKP